MYRINYVCTGPLADRAVCAFGAVRGYRVWADGPADLPAPGLFPDRRIAGGYAAALVAAGFASVRIVPVDPAEPEIEIPG